MPPTSEWTSALGPPSCYTCAGRPSAPLQAGPSASPRVSVGTGAGLCRTLAPWAASPPCAPRPPPRRSPVWTMGLPASTVLSLFSRYEVDDIDEEGKE